MITFRLKTKLFVQNKLKYTKKVAYSMAFLHFRFGVLCVKSFKYRVRLTYIVRLCLVFEKETAFVCVRPL